MKIGLFLVGCKGQQVLENLVEDIEFVLSYNDKKTFDDSFYLMKGICLGRKIRFYEGKTLPEKEYEKINKIFVIGWQFLLKNNLDKLIVIHDSNLPEYKGWSPTVNYLIEGNSYLGATAFAPTMKMDTGDIYAQETVEIRYPMKVEEAIKIVGDIYIELIRKIVAENPTSYEMVGEESFCIWRNQDDYYIDWSADAERIKRMIDAVGYPYAGAKFKYDDDIITVYDATVMDDIKLYGRKQHIGKFWTISEGLPVVVCGTGLLKLNKLVVCDGEDFKFKKLKIKL